MTAMTAGATWTQAGIGLRSPHVDLMRSRRPPCGFLEVHAENYLADAPALAALHDLRRDYPVSVHGVGLSLASAERPDAEHLAAVASLAREVDALFVSDHLAWSGLGGVYLNDLLPLPLTDEALALTARNIAIAQEALGRPILIENPSAYCAFTAATIGEAQFLRALAQRTGCGLLLDVNNIAVSAANQGFGARAYLDTLPPDAVQEIHLAGHIEEPCGAGTLRIDTHSRPVSAEVWDLYRAALARFGAIPALIEWDKDIPALEVLMGEAATADAIAAHALAERPHAA